MANRLEIEIIKAVAEEKVTSGTVLLARHYWKKIEDRARSHRKALLRSAPAYSHHREVAKAEEKEESAAMAKMHHACFQWNLLHTTEAGAPNGRCDCGCGAAFRSATEGELDHWIERSQGGPDRRENGWRLLSDCHFRKTNNLPPVGAPGGSKARATWNARRLAYCRRASIPFVERRVKP
jgi:5-methylcytosine-specific restriction endonuclease McrA